MTEDQNTAIGDASQTSNGMYNTSHAAADKEGQPTNAPDHREHVAAATRQGAMVSQVLQPQYMKLANPGPLGLLAFAITTFVVGLYECGAG